ncbi:Predicted phosphohydrolase or phosphomutase, AlkP superfamily [Solimonas aquatica]|uniref:Predicted phosphohydrolase or phosphomutase, AlkP superfamily n=1 Tax=Solimonas aquatica TaxID=489703 RepID=A0A1H9K9K9_9GAMM|nr:alkaline phosphatase family protein [Solimonas aquatica]SEQ95811.1 Predicted phosphohydrolase or phosphomutase, AlkP superfamily [Solimonas aquatica]
MTTTLFIGLDGCTFTVLDQLISDLPGEGITMPFMKSLIERGVRARLRSTPNPLTPPAWTSIMTGKNPGEHGVFEFIRAEDKGNEVFWTLYDARNVDAETIWSVASRKKKTIAALNFPLTAPAPENIKGAVVPGFIPAKHLRRNTHPRELFERIKQDVPGFDPKELAWDFDKEKQAMESLSADETAKWVRYHLPREEQWFRVAEYILGTDKPDLMAVMFDGTDKIQHQAWPWLDQSLLPKNPQGHDKEMREVCLEYFRNLDGYIKRLVEMAGPDTQVFFASDHGFTASNFVLRINTYLEEKGYLKWGVNDGSEMALRREASDFANLDWSQTTACCLTPSSNGISIRVKQKPGDPGIEPSEYEAFREKLMKDLYELKDPVSGEPVIVDLLKREEWFPGQHMKLAPDLTMVLRDHGFVSIRNLKPSIVHRPSPIGTHHPDGIFIAVGPGIPAAGLVETRKIVDVAPTLLYSAGVAVPSDFEGEVPPSFFSEAWLAEHPVKKGARTQHAKRMEMEQEMDANEQKQLLEQLQMLGYME